MELKTARLTVLIDPNKKFVFETLCAQQDRTTSQVVRQLIRDYLAQHGVEYQGSGMVDDEAEPASTSTAAQSRAKRMVKGATPSPAKSRQGRRSA